MIAEILLVLAGHSSSLFPSDHTIHPNFAPLLHPGEEQCLNSLGLIAFRYKRIKSACSKLSQSPSRYICALGAKLGEILRNEYETLVIETEAKILRRDDSLVARRSFVPLSSIRAVFAEWDHPFAALESLMDSLDETPNLRPGPLIDLLLDRSHTGIYRIAVVMSRLAEAVQHVWRAQLQSFLVYGTQSIANPLASDSYILHEGSIPSCVSMQTRDSIMYVGRAIGTVKAAKWHKQMPSSLALEHVRLLDNVLPQDQRAFESVIARIRINVSEWLWLNVMTQEDVEDAVDSLANYFLLRNGEFSLSFIREIERMKLSKLKVGTSTMIREQDLHLALLRASLGTSAQHDPSLSHLRFQLPSGPLRPLLPSLSSPDEIAPSPSLGNTEQRRFDDLLLGTSLRLTYAISWPLDLFLHTADLAIYADLFAFLTSLRYTHTRIHTCWTSLSNAQRARRRWTGLGEGGTQEDSRARQELLRCGWGVVRIMCWFMDVLLGYVMMDVVECEFKKLKELLRPQGAADEGTGTTPGIHTWPPVEHTNTIPSRYRSLAATSHSSFPGTRSTAQHLDFTTLRHFHNAYLERLLRGSLLTNDAITTTIRSILDVCIRFSAQVERWGGDVLPALLFEGSLVSGGREGVGRMAKDRWEFVRSINDTLQTLLDTFYEQLSLAASQSFSPADASKSMLMNMPNVSGMLHASVKARAKGIEGESEMQRQIERLLLRLDFNGVFSKLSRYGEAAGGGEDILKQGGLA